MAVEGGLGSAVSRPTKEKRRTAAKVLFCGPFWFWPMANEEKRDSIKEGIKNGTTRGMSFL